MKASKYLVFGVSLIITLILVACGGAPGPAPGAEEPTTAPVEVAPTPTAVETEPDPTETSVPPQPTATAAEPQSTATDEPDDGEEPDPTTAPETVSAGDPAAGETHFSQVCSACHGPGGEGIEGLGKDLTSSEFVAGLSDEELLAFIQEGRPADHPDNTTGVAMPPRGGNADLTDEQLLDIVAYIRTLQEQ